MAFFIKIYKDNPNPTEINKVVDVLKKGGADNISNRHRLWFGL